VRYTIIVVNAVPLTATARTKAMAFSLIMLMVQVSLFCCGSGARTITGEERGDRPSLNTI
jgi:hypothetical protein